MYCFAFTSCPLIAPGQHGRSGTDRPQTCAAVMPMPPHSMTQGPPRLSHSRHNTVVGIAFSGPLQILIRPSTWLVQYRDSSVNTNHQRRSSQPRCCRAN